MRTSETKIEKKVKILCNKLSQQTTSTLFRMTDNGRVQKFTHTKSFPLTLMYIQATPSLTYGSRDMEKSYTMILTKAFLKVLAF
jgi:hypothetical protein